MAGESSAAVVAAIRTQLLAASAVTNIVGTRVYGTRREADAFPLITFGPDQSEPWDAVNINGAEVFVLINGWTKEEGEMATARTLKGAIVDALHDATLTVSGHTAVLCRVQDSRLISADVNDRISGCAVRVQVITH